MVSDFGGVTRSSTSGGMAVFSSAMITLVLLRIQVDPEDAWLTTGIHVVRSKRISISPKGVLRLTAGTHGREQFEW